MTHILLVEDDLSIIQNLSYFLQSEGFQVTNVKGQKDAITILEQRPFDLVLLDISLEDGNGFAICSYIKNTTAIPVIFLTASGDEFSVVTGLDMGADDYIAKPFRPRELISRIKTVLRRNDKTKSILEYEHIKIDTVKGTVTKFGEEVFLSALEYKILLVFFNNKGIILSRTKLLEEIWDIAGEFVNDNTLTVYIKRIREKIEVNPQEPEIIRTVRGLGYKVG